MCVVDAKEPGMPPERLAGTIQNDEEIAAIQPEAAEDAFTFC